MKSPLHAVVVTAVIVAAAACGKGSSSPVSSSPVPSTSAANPYQAAPAGATIQGSVTALAAASARRGFHALGSAGIKVSVVGTTLASVSDDSGRFSIASVPAGPVALRFQGPGVDAQLQLEHVAEGEMVEIEVHISGGQATMTKPGDDTTEASVRGTLQAINGAVLQVADHSVVTDSATRFQGHGDASLSLADLRVGDALEVEGTLQADGSILAKSVSREDDTPGASPSPQPEQEVSFSGAIGSLSPLTVAGRTVMTDGNTRVQDHKGNRIGLSALKVGDTVEVEGTTRSDGSVLATKIKVED